MFSRVLMPLVVVAVAGVALLADPPSAQAAWDLDMPAGKSVLADEIMGLHHLILLICTIACAGVFGFAFYTIITCRRSTGAKAAKFSHSTTAEVIWTIIPTLILVGMAIPSARAIIKIEDTSGADLSIKVTGYQWKWSYDYLNEDKFFFSTMDRASNAASQRGSGIDPTTVENYLRNVDNAMVVPVNKKVRLLMTSNDVIHSWWVPELYIKKDANPGFVNEAWFEATETGVYRGQCTELCGRGHGFMPVVVVVVTESEYAAWLGGELAWNQVEQRLVATNINSAADGETVAALQ